MERLTSDDLQLSSTETTLSSSYCDHQRTSLNGYTSVAVVPPSSVVADEMSDDTSERVGVFDYVLSSSPHKDDNFRTFSSATVSAAAVEGDPGRLRVRQKWAQDVQRQSSDACGDNGTELTTFSCSDSDACSRPMNAGSYQGSEGVKNDAASCSELDEIVVQSEVQPQRASFERYDPDFPYPGLCRSNSVHEPATVYVTSYSKPNMQSSYRAIDASDERDVIERRSRQCTPPCKFVPTCCIFTC